MEQESNNPNNYENFHDAGVHNVSFAQWIIIIVLGLAILSGFYFGCSSNRTGVTMTLPNAPAAGAKK